MSRCERYAEIPTPSAPDRVVHAPFPSTGPRMTPTRTRARSGHRDAAYEGGVRYYTDGDAERQGMRERTHLPEDNQGS